MVGRRAGGGRFELRWPCGEVPEMTRRVIFSEGCALRVRKYGPDASPKDGMITGRQATGRWPSGDMPGRSQRCHCGRAEPAPPGGELSKLGWPWGKTGGHGGMAFSEGRGLRARVARPYAGQRIPSQPDGSPMSRWPGGGNVGVGIVP